MTAFAPLLDILAEVPDPRRGQGQKYKLPYVLLFAILAVVTGGNSYRSIVTFIDSLVVLSKPLRTMRVWTRRSIRITAKRLGASGHSRL